MAVATARRLEILTTELAAEVDDGRVCFVVSEIIPILGQIVAFLAVIMVFQFVAMFLAGLICPKRRAAARLGAFDGHGDSVGRLSNVT